MKLFDFMQPTDLLFITFLKDIGMTGPEFKNQWSVDNNETVHVDVRYSYPMNMAEALSTTNKPSLKVFKALQEKLSNSDFVKREKEELQIQLDDANVKLKDLQAKIVELEKFKTYFDLEQQMRQGAKK